MIWKSEYIVRASFVSIVATTEELSGWGPGSRRPDTTYRPIHRLTFTVHEWLKGTGPEQIIVTVRPTEYSSYYVMPPKPWPATAAEAQSYSNRKLSERVTDYDDREALLFLAKDTAGWYQSSYDIRDVVDRVRTFVFHLYDEPHYTIWKYTIKNSPNRVWIPASASEQEGATGESSHFIESTDGTTWSLADFRRRKAALENTFDQNTEEYNACIRDKISHMAYLETIDMEEERAKAPKWYIKSATIQSGSPQGTRLSQFPSYSEGVLPWYTSPHFQLADSRDGTVTARPLPAGTYVFKEHLQHDDWLICEYKPDKMYANYTVTVEAPEGTIAEALFDPTTIGTAVGQDGVSDLLSSVKWEADTVTISVTEALGAYVIQVIELDGSVSLTLGVPAAARNENTYTWSVADQPWEAGDKLMLRIRRAPPHTPTPRSP